MLWAFAREGGIPFSKYVARVSCFKSICIALFSGLYISGRSTNPPPTIRDWNHDDHQPTVGIDQHRIIRRVRRLHLFDHCELLFFIHPVGLRDAQQTSHDSRLRLTLGPVQTWACRRPCHRRGASLLRPRRLLLHVAHNEETNGGEYELLCRGVRQRHGIQPFLLVCLWQEILHRSGPGVPGLGSRSTLPQN